MLTFNIYYLVVVSFTTKVSLQQMVSLQPMVSLQRMVSLQPNVSLQPILSLQSNGFTTTNDLTTTNGFRLNNIWNVFQLSSPQIESIVMPWNHASNSFHIYPILYIQGSHFLSASSSMCLCACVTYLVLLIVRCCFEDQRPVNAFCPCILCIGYKSGRSGMLYFCRVNYS